MIDTEDEDVDARRFTTVHSRYHVIGMFGDDGSLEETCETRSEAFRVAAANLGPKGYERVEVYDSMARRGQPRLWSVDANGVATVMELRS